MKDGIPIHGAESATLNISTAEADDAGSYQCLVKNKYAQVLSNTAQITFTNQAPVVNDQEFFVPDFSVAGVSLGTVLASDPDTGDSLTYSITGGNQSGDFTINATTGELTTAGDIHHHKMLHYVLEVTVSDNGTPSLSDTAYITVTLQYNSGETKIVANSGGPHNDAIPDTFGDRVTDTNNGIYIHAFEVTQGGTPNIDLTWSTINNLNNNNTRWEFNNWGGAITDDGGALQLEGSKGDSSGDPDPFIRNNVHQITFTPDPGFAATLIGFNFIGDTNGDTYQYNWRVIRLSDSAVVASGQTPQWTTDDSKIGRPNWDGAPSVDINYAGVPGEAFRLEIAQSIGSTGDKADIAIDNLRFSQTKATSLPIANLTTTPDYTAQSIDLQWRPAGSNFNADGIQVFRDGTLIATLPLNASQYLDHPPFPTPATLTYQYTIRAYGGWEGGPDTDITASQTLIVDSDGDGMRDAWEMTHFQNLSQGKDDDYDHDGKSNFREYAEGDNPTVATYNTMPRVTEEVVNGQTYPVLHYVRSAYETDVIYIPESSTDLTNWSSDTSHFIPFGNPTDLGNGQREFHLRYYQTLDAATQSRIMFRVRMEPR